MRTALIGHTGFVGSNLLAQAEFTDLYNSKNIDGIAGSFDLVVCAGVSAVKWKANKEPEADLAGIRRLLDRLGGISAERFVLISTVDVYADAANVDEASLIDPQANHPYGRHRFMAEEFVRETFPGAAILRLPGLFGKGLKKNVIFDLLNDNCLEMINPRSSFQYYPLERLWADARVALDAKLDLVNLVTEPVGTGEIIEAFFPEKKALVGAKAAPEAHYDVRTVHAGAYGGRDGYVMSRKAVLERMGRFVGAYVRTV